MILSDILPYINSAIVVPTAGTVLAFVYRRQKLLSDEQASNRDSDRAEISVLRTALRVMQDEMNQHRRDFQEDITRQRRECEVEQEHLRGEIRQLHEEIMGLRRQQIATSTAIVEKLPDVPESIARAGARAAAALDAPR